MILSMTGVGRAELRQGEWTAHAEVRTLNNRFLDLNLRLPPVLRHREPEVRTLIAERVQRGKTDVALLLLSEKAAPAAINLQTLMAYYAQLRPLIKKFNAKKSDLLPVLLQLPDIMQSTRDDADELLWTLARNTLVQALDLLQSYRKEEGKNMETALRRHTEQILLLLAETEPMEEERRRQIRNRLQDQLAHWRTDAGLDAARLEQELIYYLERMDFTEEKVRLSAHASFFLQTLSEPESNGRRLTFIAQEMGREINTLGAKAYHAGIQQQVVRMKEELEKIKEQLQNVL
ncbi:MAG: YicC/YloC family endoribonuclease [Chitinophagales bacterium]|nr:YicC/YloC family endoribonuclease [Chitinophagales bacterium]